jgi:hypothetical protein
MRARARIALVLMALCASFGLAGCAAIEELKEAFLRWVESEKLPPAGRGPFADDLPDATPVIPPEKPSKKEASKPTKRQISAQTATAADRCCASSRETSDPGLHRGGEAGRHRGSIRAVFVRAAAVA